MKNSKKFYIFLESFPNLKEIIALHKEQNPSAKNFKLNFNEDIYGTHILEYEVGANNETN